MGKSVRINVSLPEQLHGVYAEVAQRTGVSLPQVLVNALVAQSAYTRRWVANWNYRARPVDREAFSGDAGVIGDGVSTPAVPVREQSSGRLSRQQRRAQQRLLAKVRE